MEDLQDAAAHARRNVDFIDFDRARNRIRAALAAGENQERARAEKQGSELQRAAKLINLATEVMAGYSGTPLVRKLGIRPNEKIVALHPPDHYETLLEDLPEGATITNRVTAGAPFVHLFATRRADLEKQLTSLRTKLAEAGILWVSWPKKSSGVATDISEDTIREVALPLGFVDVKVCAVDETWSGLKLMIRRENRKA